jgi:hypothetical protein
VSIEAAGPEYAARVEALRLGEDDDGYGWLIFAGTMLVLLGVTNFIEGIAAISDSHFFVARAHYLFGDLESYGWVLLLNGLVQAGAGLGIFLKNQSARWLGVLLAGYVRQSDTRGRPRPFTQVNVNRPGCGTHSVNNYERAARNEARSPG